MAASVSPAAVSLRRGPRPGDLGEVLAMHGDVYAREYGFDEGFEAHVAHGLADFATALHRARAGRHTPAPGWLWVAELAEQPVGTVALTDQGDLVAQLRWFLVRPDVRGIGLGHRLLHTALEHAHESGFVRVQLWTVPLLGAAARLYTQAGFRCTERHHSAAFGPPLEELRYDLDLS